MDDDDNAKQLIIYEGFVDFTGHGSLGVVIAAGGDGVKRRGVPHHAISRCTT